MALDHQNPLGSFSTLARHLNELVAQSRSKHLLIFDMDYLSLCRP
jgi:hypothetical protein